MHTAELSLKTLWQLSPGLADDFQQRLEAAVMDCKQRPSLASKREITLKLTGTVKTAVFPACQGLLLGSNRIRETGGNLMDLSNRAPVANQMTFPRFVSSPVTGCETPVLTG